MILDLRLGAMACRLILMLLLLLLGGKRLRMRLTLNVPHDESVARTAVSTSMVLILVSSA
jgi:hypothetical protein